MIQHRCWQPRSHDAHTWNDGTEDRRCNGSPFTTRAVSPELSVAPDAPRPDDSDQRQGGVAPEFPTFDVHPGYVMHADSIALHFHPDAVPVLAALFPAQADNLHAAALDVEMEAERQEQQTADRALLRGVGR